jgi:hypothetical protein
VFSDVTADAWIFVFALVSLTALTGGVLLLAWSRHRLGLVSVVAFVAAVCFWIAAFAAASSGYRDADAFAGCGESCTGVHLATGLGLVAPPLLIALAAGGMLVALLSRARRKRAAAEGV